MNLRDEARGLVDLFFFVDSLGQAAAESGPQESQGHWWICCELDATVSRLVLKFEFDMLSIELIGLAVL